MEYMAEIFLSKVKFNELLQQGKGEVSVRELSVREINVASF